MAQPQGIAGALKGTLGNNIKLENQKMGSPTNGKRRAAVVLTNRAGESRSPYVLAHATNPVAWQIWGEQTIELARRENKLLFVSIGYSACHCKFSGPGWVRRRTGSSSKNEAD